jgi:hypothetical protein
MGTMGYGRGLRELTLETLDTTSNVAGDSQRLTANLSWDGEMCRINRYYSCVRANSNK